MRKSEYLQHRAALRRLDRYSTLFCATALLALVAIAIPLAALLPSAGHRRWVALCLLAGGLGVAGFHGYLRWRVRRAGLACRGCGVTLLGAPGDVALASDRCGHCGDTVFES